MHFAYLDPGTGSIVLQAVIGTMLGVIVVFRSYITRFISKIRPSSNSKNTSDED